MDLLMGTRGWRRFDWKLAFAPPAPEDALGAEMPAGGGEGRGFARQGMRGHRARPANVRLPMAAPPPPPAAEPMAIQAEQKAPMQPAEKELAKREARGPMVGRAMGVGRRDRFVAEDDEWADWAPVRVFPAPRYTPGEKVGPRTDFRETIYWAHDVQTGKDGTAKLTFHLSDAVTSFRAVAEGVSSAGLPGRGEAVVQSKMPLSLDARLPVEVSAGDRIALPVSLTNETERAITADLTASFGPGVQLAEPPSRAR
jgi:hypothetical protein